MALAETTEVEEMKPVMVTHIDLLLNQDEADALLTVLDKVGGHPQGTRRGLIQEIRTALAEAGARGDSSDVWAEGDLLPTFTQGGPSSIYFVNPITREWNDGRTA